MKQAKKTEHCKTLEDEETDVFAIVREENVKYFNLKNYHLNFVPKSRQIASDILIRTCKTIKHEFSVTESMNDFDKTEIIILTVWKMATTLK